MTISVIKSDWNNKKFWSQHKNISPELYRLQLKYFSVPVNFVHSERVFSKTGQLTNDRRKRPRPNNLGRIYIFF